jgi:predicted 2-oxoglutarate/Fe(II)-dependent dioxygenase YbiX
MEFNFIADGIDAVVIDNFYTEEQLVDISNELTFLTKPSIMEEDKDKLEAAVDLDGNFITTKAGVWVDTVFRDWKHSALISHPMNNFGKQETVDKIISYNSLFSLFYHCNIRTHLLSYYENSGYYSKHTDAAVFTVLSYFHKEPKVFTGGNIILHNRDNTKKANVEIKNNRVIIIPSCTVHEVEKIEMTSKKLSGEGRYCCAIFLTVQHLKEKHNDSN